MKTITAFLLSALALTLPAFTPGLRGQTTAVNFTLHSCDNNSNGNGDVHPTAPLLLGTDGKFYGTTHGTEGTAAAGSVFQITAQGQYANLHTFAGDEGGYIAEGGLIEGDDGAYYGLSIFGGLNNNGTMFKVVVGSLAEVTALHKFVGGSGGSFPHGTLVRANNGFFYGTTKGGGQYDRGTIFKANSAGHVDVIHSFSGDMGGMEGGYPVAGLVQDDDGILYGTTSGVGNSYGTVYKIEPANGNKFTTLYRFTGGADGYTPQAALILGCDGKLYGTTTYGGSFTASSSGSGTVFSITPAGDLTTLHRFVAGEGNDPLGALLRDDDGTFYGTTSAGGGTNDAGSGTVFQMTADGTLTTVYVFTGSSQPHVNNDGAQPQAAIIHSHLDDYFYGTTFYGGMLGQGTVFRMKITRPPVITSASSASGQVGKTFSYQIKYLNQATRLGALGLPPGLHVNAQTGLISGTPTAPVKKTITLTASNAAGTGTASLALTILLAAPAITSADTDEATVGESYSYQITASNKPTSFGAVGLPPRLHVDAKAGLISGTPTKAGTFKLTLKAANAGGTGQGTLTLTVKPAPPAITSAATASGKVGVAFSYQITATNDPTSFGVLGLPPGLHVSKDGLINGTPTKAGTPSLTLKAANAGGTGTATLKLTISN